MPAANRHPSGRTARAVSAPSSASAPTSVADAAVSILEEHDRTGAPLDGVLGRYIRGRSSLSATRRHELSDRVVGVARRQGRLDWRLSDVGLRPSARNRLLADHALAGRPLTEVGLPLTQAERAWLREMEAPLETPSMDRRAMLECPDWAWAPFCDTFGAERASTELSALCAASRPALPLCVPSPLCARPPRPPSEATSLPAHSV
jgi:hypothetical protein